MLRKDNENITKGLKGMYEKELSFLTPRTKTVTFKLVNSIYNGKDKRPRSVHLETSYVSLDPNTGDASEIRYYKSENKKKIGGFVQETFSPEFVGFAERGDVTINIGEKQANNLDLLLFYLLHPRLAKSRSGDGVKRAMFYLEDKNKEAKDKMAFKRDKAKMDHYLLNEETMLSEDKLRTIASALRVSGLEDMNLQSVQLAIESKCKKNPSIFLTMTEVSDDVLMRSNIQKASELGYITFSVLDGRWTLNDSDSGEKSDLAPVRKNEDETNALVYWFKNVDVSDSYSKIEELLTGKAKKRTPKVEAPETSELETKLKLAEAENEKLRLETEKAKAELEKAKLLSKKLDKKKANA